MSYPIRKEDSVGAKYYYTKSRMYMKKTINSPKIWLVVSNLLSDFLDVNY